MKKFNEFINEVKEPTGDLKKACWTGYTAVGTKKKNGRTVPNCVPEEVEIEEGMQQTLRKFVPGYAKRQIDNKMDAEKFGKRDVDRDANFHRYKKIQDKLKKEEVELDETAAWQRKEGKRESGGLNQKGVESYRREHPGSKLKTAVTTKPSKLKAGSAAANRRKSFCARMSGMKKRLTSAATAKDPDSRINKSLRKWNC